MDEAERQIRRHFQEVQMKLEQDFTHVIQDLEMSKNRRIKELKNFVSEVQATAVKLEGLSQQLEQTSVFGTAVEVIDECASDMSTTRLEALALIPEVADDKPLHFTKSAILQQADNLVGRLTISKCASLVV